MQLRTLVLGGVLLALHGLAVAGLLRRLASRPTPGRAADLLCLGATASPLALGIAVVLMLAALGPRSDSQYLITLALSGLTLVALSQRPLRALGQELRLEFGGALARFTWRDLARIESVLIVLMLLAACSVAVRVVSLPLFDNDPMEYALVGRALYDQRTIAAYPLVQADPQSGMYAPTTHPPMYVALVFLANVIQGSAASPGAMRWIAPLCFFLAVIALMRLARAAGGRVAGLFAGLLMLSLPILQLQASGGAIDLLPVLGLSLAMASAGVMAAQALPARIAVTGAALGLALWTHSVAVLFPILIIAAIIVMRRIDGRSWLAECAGVAAVATAIAIAPYLRNVAVFGAVISDTPAVVLLPNLDWAGYFTHARGLSTGYEKLTLGVLRGWSDPLFGASFWLMTAAAAALLIQRFVHRTPVAAIVGGALAIVATYELLMIASVAAGSYEMIKNIRYALPMTPAVALVGGYGLAGLAAQTRWGGLAPLAALLIAGLSCAPALNQVLQRTRAAYEQLSAPVAGDDLRLMAYAPYRLQRYMRDALPDNATVLAFQPALMYYGRHRMVSFLDPRLIPAYAERDPLKAAARLKEVGVTHLMRPPYSLPVITDSALAGLMADPRLVRIVKSDEHYTLLELLDSQATDPAPTQAWDLSPSRLPWPGTTNAWLPLLGPLCEERALISTNDWQPTIRGCRFLPRHRATYLAGAGSIATAPGAVYRYTALLSGRGFATIQVEEHRDGRITTRVIDGAVLASQERTLTRWLRFDEGVAAVRFGLTMEGDSAVAINRFTVDEIPQ